MNRPADPLPHAAGRIVLRRLDPAADLAAFQAYRHDTELGRYQGWSAMDDAAATAFLAEMAAMPWAPPGAWMQFGIALRNARAGASDGPDDRGNPRAEWGRTPLIGDIGLHLDPAGREAEIGYTLAAAHQHHGLASEALRAALALVFATTPVERIVGITDARNRASCALLERIGMRHVATADAVFRGEPCVERTYVAARRG